MILSDVEAQHLTERQFLDRVSTCLLKMKEGTAPDGQTLVDAIHQMADVKLRHIAFEESIVLPLARQCLHDQDWVEIADAFTTNCTPRFGDLPVDDFRELFTRIANVAMRAEPLAEKQ